MRKKKQPNSLNLDAIFVIDDMGKDFCFITNSTSKEKEYILISNQQQIIMNTSYQESEKIKKDSSCYVVGTTKL